MPMQGACMYSLAALGILQQEILASEKNTYTKNSD